MGTRLTSAETARHVGWIGDVAASRELMDTNNKLTNAYLQENVPVLKEMLDEAHVHNNVFGMALTKEEFLRDIETGILEFESYRTTKIKWHIDTRTAVATGVINAHAKRAGQAVPATEFLFTRVFVRRNGQWKVLLFHNTMMPKTAGSK